MLSAQDLQKYHAAKPTVFDIEEAVDLLEEFVADKVSATKLKRPNVLLGRDLGSRILLKELVNQDYKPTAIIVGLAEENEKQESFALELGVPFRTTVLNPQSLRSDLLHVLHIIGPTSGLYSVLRFVGFANISVELNQLLIASHLELLGSGVDSEVLDYPDDFTLFWKQLWPKVARLADADEIDTLAMADSELDLEVQDVFDESILLLARSFEPELFFAEDLESAPIRLLAKRMGVDSRGPISWAPGAKMMENIRELMLEDAKVLVGDQLDGYDPSKDPYLSERLWMRLIGELGF